MASTNATFPLRAMSIMSPPERGQSSTRLPFLSSTPPATTLCSVGRPSNSRKKSTLISHHLEFADGPVQVYKLLRRESLAPGQDLPRSRVGGTHLLLLFIREGENIQNE